MNSSGAVYVVDDDPGVAQCIGAVLASLEYPVETFGTADEFLARGVGDLPSCLLIDLLLPGISGLDLCKEVVSRKLPCTFVVITGHGDVSSAVEAMRLGAIDYLEKPFSRQRMVAGIKVALDEARRRFETSALKQDIVARLASLSRAERKVFDCLADGLLTKEIAKRLGISTRTVDVHRSRIMSKLRLESPLQLAHFFYMVSVCEESSTRLRTA